MTATIGTLTKSEDGQHTGIIRTLRFVQPFNLSPIENGQNNHKSPSYDVLAKAIDDEDCKIGAVWKKTSERGTEYLWFVLHDPFIPEELRSFSAFTSSTQNVMDLVKSSLREDQNQAAP